MMGNAIYDADIEAGVRAGLTVYKIYESLIFADIRNACEILRPVYESSEGLDSYVSIEVPPRSLMILKPQLGKPDAIETLEKDHGRIRSLFSELEGSDDPQ